MKKYLFLLVLALLGSEMRANGPEIVPSEPKLFQTGLTAEGNDFFGTFDKRKRKKRKRNRTFAAGLVVGAPAQLGLRVVLRPTRLAVAGDIGWSRLRNDFGTLTDITTIKLDARYYGDQFLAKLVRFYVLGGATIRSGKFNETSTETLFAANAGLGGGIKLWKLEVNAEAGLMVPINTSTHYDQRFGVFSNIGILFWLF